MTPEQLKARNALISAGQKRAWADPEIRARRAAAIIKPGDKAHLIKPKFEQPMIWVVPPGVHHITIQRTGDGEVLEKRAVKPGQIIMLDELNVRANAKPAATLDVIGKDGLIKP